MADTKTWTVACAEWPEGPFAQAQTALQRLLQLEGLGMQGMSAACSNTHYMWQGKPEFSAPGEHSITRRVVIPEDAWTVDVARERVAAMEQEAPRG